MTFKAKYSFKQIIFKKIFYRLQVLRNRKHFKLGQRKESADFNFGVLGRLINVELKWYVKISQDMF